MKRKGVHIKEDKRKAKRIKLDEPVEALNADVVQQIFKYLDDTEFIRCARVCKTWHRASIRERNRFIEQRITGLKMSFSSKTKELAEFTDMFQVEWDYRKNELESLAKIHADWLKELKRRGTLSTLERFDIWYHSPVPKEHHESRTEVAPAGEKRVLAMFPFNEDNDGDYFSNRIYDVDDIIRYIGKDLGVTKKALEKYRKKKWYKVKKSLAGNGNNDKMNNHEDIIDHEESKKLMKLERYLEHMIEINFGSFFNDSY